MAKKLSDEVMVERIQKWAMDNYENGADYIVECFSAEEIKEEFFHDYDGNRLNTWKEIFDRVKRTVRVREEQRKEIQSAW